MEPPKDRQSYCTLYLARHGETDWNTRRLCVGWSDIPLNENGERQASQLSELFRSISFDTVYSSDLVRARRTAEILSAERKLTHETSHLLREMFYGDYEGRHVDDFANDKRILLEQTGKLTEEELRTVAIGNSESEENAIKRFTTALREISIRHTPKTVLIVAHGGVIRTLLHRLEWATREQLPACSFSNCGYVKLLCDGIDFFVEDVVGATLKQ